MAGGSPVAAPVLVAPYLLYAMFAQGVAAISVIEIGPNLLAGVTSVVGAVVFLAQLFIVRKVSKHDSEITDVKQKVGADRRENDE